MSEWHVISAADREQWIVADIRINGHRQLAYRLVETAEYGSGVPQK